MRSALNVRTCHLLRAMRAAAPAEWNEGLPFPSMDAVPGVEPATTEPEELSIAAWLDSRAAPRFLGASNRIQLALPAIIARLAGQAHAHLDGLAKRASDLFDPENLRRRAWSLDQLRERELARIQLARQAR